MAGTARFVAFFLVAFVALGAIASPARADTVRPRFVIIVDTSGSMTENAGRVRTHGDGSQTHPGCDLDGNGVFDDSKLYQAKQALAQTMTAFGSAEFSLARYHQTELGQACATTNECLALPDSVSTPASAAIAATSSRGCPPTTTSARAARPP